MHDCLKLAPPPPLPVAPPPIGRLHLVELAGSERLDKSVTEATKLTEAKSVNRSLDALGRVLAALAAPTPEGGGRGPKAAAADRHPAAVPFKDSKLTRLLKDSLLGNCRASLLTALHPTAENYDECLSTLQFAVRCQNPTNAAAAPRVSGAEGGGGMPRDAAVEQLVLQVSALKSELEVTHSHYQKLLEAVAGPGWSKDMGPMERGGEEGSEAAAATVAGGKGIGGEPARRGVTILDGGSGASPAAAAVATGVGRAAVGVAASSAAVSRRV